VIDSPALLLVATVAVVGVLHTIVPDHWVPITLIARQRGWTRAETARVAFKAGIGHVLSTLAIALVIWGGGVAVATRFGQWVDTIASIALIGFGGWIAISSWRDLHAGGGHGHGGHEHGHGHSHDFSHLHDANSVHGPELQKIETEHGLVELSIFETGTPPRFRLSGNFGDASIVETRRDDGSRQDFIFRDRGDYWESIDEIPEPHQFAVTLTMDHEGHAHAYTVQFAEHAHDGHGYDDHTHGHPQPHKTKNRTALLLILGSSPMVEGIPAFFAAGKYGVGLIVLMSVVFGAATIATYVLLCVYSTARLQRVSLGPLERYGEVLSGGFIALVGLAFWIWPVL
jgi:ABC-type nickel/cobalt efflux system permease component RcnA